MTGEQAQQGSTVAHRPPSLAPRIASAGLTVATSIGLGLLVGLLALIVLGGLAVLGLLVTGHSLDGLSLANPADPSTFVPRQGPYRSPPPTWVAPVVVGVCGASALVMAALGAARFGHGTVGDGMTGIQTRAADGGVPSRPRVVLRTAVPVALGVVVAALWSIVVAALLLLLLWSPALLTDRRTAIDRLLGLRPSVTVMPKRGRAWTSPVPAPDEP